MTFKDKTFCASPNCANECGRKMTKNERDRLDYLRDKGGEVLVSYARFCGGWEFDENEMV